MTDKTQSSHDKGKRSFIKKATIVGSMSAMAPASVWGACNASGVSGGSQDINNVCVVPAHLSTVGADAWVRFLTTPPSNSYKKSSVRNLFNIPNSEKFGSSDGSLNNKNKNSYYFHQIASALNSAELIVETKDRFGDIHSETINVGSALVSSDNFKKQAAALYASYVFGLADIPSEYQKSGGMSLLLNHLYGVEINSMNAFSIPTNSNSGSESSLKDGLEAFESLPKTK